MKKFIGKLLRGALALSLFASMLSIPVSAADPDKGTINYPKFGLNETVPAQAKLEIQGKDPVKLEVSIEYKAKDATDFTSFSGTGEPAKAGEYRITFQGEVSDSQLEGGVTWNGEALEKMDTPDEVKKPNTYALKQMKFKAMIAIIVEEGTTPPPASEEVTEKLNATTDSDKSVTLTVTADKAWFEQVAPTLRYTAKKVTDQDILKKSESKENKVALLGEDYEENESVFTTYEVTLEQQEAAGGAWTVIHQVPGKEVKKVKLTFPGKKGAYKLAAATLNDQTYKVEPKVKTKGDGENKMSEKAAASISIKPNHFSPFLVGAQMAASKTTTITPLPVPVVTPTPAPAPAKEEPKKEEPKKDATPKTGAAAAAGSALVLAIGAAVAMKKRKA